MDAVGKPNGKTAAGPHAALLPSQQAVSSNAARQTACIICCAPRTGSSVLAEALAATGHLGRPQEYFDIHDKNRKHWVQALSIQQPSEYLDKVIAAGSTPNGMFGLKLHWHQIPALVDAFAQTTGTTREQAAKRPLDEWLKTRFRTAHFLWLRRRNKIAQGISYYRATRSDIWRVRQGGGAKARGEKSEIAFNFNEIDRHIRLGEEFDNQWLAFFKARRLKALILVYEDLIANYEETLRGVWKYLGMADHPLTIAPIRLEKQADDVSQEWEEEYRRLKKQGGASKAAAAATPRPAEADAAMPRRSMTASVMPGRRPKPADTPIENAPQSPTQPVGEPEVEPDTLVAYDLGSHLRVRLVSAPQRRGWMDRTHNRFAYRCLPLVMANQNGWMLLNPARFRATWDGGQSIESLKIEYDPTEKQRLASSHFGSGVITFALSFLFRTPRGVNLYVRGPANLPKDGVSALEGIVETDWSEATFTMNWKLTRPHYPVVFEKNEPFAMLSPIRRGDLERVRPEIRTLADNPTLETGYRAFSASRDGFNKGLKVKDSPEQKLGWQRHYIRGKTVTDKKADEHQTTLKLREFLDKRRK